LTNAFGYYYLNTSGGSATGTEYWWTMSPSFWNSNDARGFYVGGSGYPGRLWNNRTKGGSCTVRPVVSLNAEVVVTGGDGSANKPYKVTLPQ